MRIEIEVKRQEWGFEVWHTTYDDKNKKIGQRQQGAAVCGPAEEDFKRALALMDPFRRRV